MEDASSAARFGDGRSAQMLLTRTPGQRREPIAGRTLPQQRRHHNDRSMGGSGGGPSPSGGGGAPGAAVDSGASNGFYGGGAPTRGDAASASNNGGGNFAGDGAGGHGDFGRGGKGKGMGKGGKGGPMRVPRGRVENRDRDRDRDRGYKAKDGRQDRNKIIDNDFNWRARTVEEADAAIDMMQGAVGPAQRPQAGPAPPPGSRGAEASSPQDAEADTTPEQDSPPKEVWPALGSAAGPTAEAEIPLASPGQGAGGNNAAPTMPASAAGSPVVGPGSTALPAGVLAMGANPGQMGQMVVMAMAPPFAANPDGQSIAPDDNALQGGPRPPVKAAPGPPQPAAGLGGANAGPHGMTNPGIMASGAPGAPCPTGGPTGASAQKPMLPVKASTKAYARSNAKAAMPKVSGQAPFPVPALAAAPSPAAAPAPQAAMPAPTGMTVAASGPPEEVPSRAAPPAAVTLLVPQMMPLEVGAPGAPGPSSGVTIGVGNNALPKAAPAPVVMPVQTGPPAPTAGGGPGGTTSGSTNNEALVEAPDGDGSELKTLLGRGAAPPSGDADAKLGRSSVRLQGVEDWVLYLQPRREGESQQMPTPVRRAVAGRGRGRGRIMNLRLDRVRGAGRAAAPVTSGDDGNEATMAEAVDEQPSEPPAAEPMDAPCERAADGPAEANVMPSAGTSSSTQAAPVQSASATQNGTPAVNSWTQQATASTALGRGGSSAQHPRRRGRAWEDIDGMLDLDGEEESAQITSSMGTAAVSSTSDGTSLPASGDMSTAAAERRTCSPATGSARVPCEGSPAAASTAAAQASEPQAHEEDTQASAAAGIASAVSSTSAGGSTTASGGTTAERRPPCAATGSASEPSMEGSPAVASTAVAAQSTEAQAVEASSSSTSPAPPGAVASSTASSTRPRPEAPLSASATATAAPGGAPASGTSSGGAAGLMRLAMDAPPGTGEAGGAGGWAGSTGGWERNFRRDDELLRGCGLWCKKVEADGACLFRAFSDQLEGDGGSMHLKYRDKCVTYLEEYRADFEPFIVTNFKEYCAKLREPAAWGGHVEAQALSRALGVNALIHLPDEAEAADDVPEKAIEVLNFGEDAPCVQLCFHPRYHSGAHYNSVRCCGDKGDGVPSVSSLSELRERMLEVLRTRRQRQGGTAS